MSLSFFFTQTEHDERKWALDGRDWAIQMRQQLLESPDTYMTIVSSPEDADIIVFWEPHQDSQAIWVPRLRAHPLVLEFPNRVFVVSVEDSPLGVFPGVYTSLNRRSYDKQRHRTWFYYRTENPYIQSSNDYLYDSCPTMLASFKGATSSSVRARLFRIKQFLAAHKIFLTRTEHRRFALNPLDPKLKQAQVDYIDTILNSKFSLCPRGNGVGSYRLQESMALGRSPVIISDDWVPVSDLDWRSFAILVKERDIGELPAILREYESEWKEMGQRALATYQAVCQRDTFAKNTLDHIVAIYRNRTHDEREYISEFEAMIKRQLSRK